VGRERHHEACRVGIGHAFERGKEEPGVRRELLDVGVRRHHDQNAIPRHGCSRKEALRRGGEPADRLSGHAEAKPACGRLEERAESERG